MARRQTRTDSAPSSSVSRLEWNDLIVLLAICRAGSLVGAARALRKDHSTLYRKLNQIEDRAGVRFFERLPSGYLMTDAGELALRFGERIEGEFHALSSEIDGRDAQLRGHVRITAPDGVCTGILPPILAEFRQRHPDVTLDVLEGMASLDLSRREAEIAIRATRKPPDDGLGKKICDFRFAAYASPAYLAKAGKRPLSEHPWIFLHGTIDWTLPALFRNRATAEAAMVLQTNSATVALAAARAGVGITLMPCYRGDADPGLRRAGEPLEHLAMELWILTHPVLRHTARVRTLMAFLTEALSEHADLFAGELGDRAARRRSS